MPAQAVVMVVDDDSEIRYTLTEALADEGYDVIATGSAEEALSRLEEVLPDMMLIDIKMPQMDGMALLEEAKKRDPNLTAIMLTGYGSVDSAVDAMRAGAFDFIEKPFRMNRLKVAIRKALENQSLRREVLRLRAEHRQREGDIGSLIIGDSPAMKQIYRVIRQVAKSPAATVLVHGESGVGKELIARAIHNCSSRRNARFVDINCAALTESLLEAELFGYEKGAFTGAATTGKQGLFEAANGGTIFLDEIGEMPVALQAKLLRVLQEKRFKRVGGVDDVEVDVRIIASTNRDLEKLVAEDRFRLDLYYRLRVIPIRVPPLRERNSDIALLAAHFLEIFNAELERSIVRITPEAHSKLNEYCWPGNVRELKNVIERAVILCSGEEIGPDLLLFGEERRFMKQSSAFQLPSMSIAEMEKRLIQKVLDDTSWRRSEAAAILGINRTTLYNKIRDYELQPNPPT